MTRDTCVHRRLRPLFADLRNRPLNFDPRGPSARTPETGWYIDDHRQPLPAEPPGPPLADGSWEIARRLVRSYAFADPAVVRRVCGTDDPAAGRNLLLEGRFYGLRFYLGVRIGDVVDEVVDQDGRRARVWGWNYRTLCGHLERGQMDHEVRKWLDTGEVEFRIHAFSQRARIPNPVIRLGFLLFGRYTQVKSHRRACRRMAALTAAELARRRNARGEGSG